jgi:hypothetical protein
MYWHAVIHSWGLAYCWYGPVQAAWITPQYVAQVGCSPPSPIEPDLLLEPLPPLEPELLPLLEPLPPLEPELLPLLEPLLPPKPPELPELLEPLPEPPELPELVELLPEPPELPDSPSVPPSISIGTSVTPRIAVHAVASASATPDTAATARMAFFTSELPLHSDPSHS